MCGEVHPEIRKQSYAAPTQDAILSYIDFKASSAGFKIAKPPFSKVFRWGIGNRENSIPKDIVATEYVDARFEAKCPCFRDQNGRQRRISTKETKNKKALKIAEEFERAARTKRTLKQVPIFFVNGSAWCVRLSVKKNDCDSGDNA